MRVRAGVVALLVVVASCSGGGGGSSNNAAAAFADATCQDLAHWAAALQPAFTDLQAAANLDLSNPDSAKAQLTKLSTELGAAADATGTLADGIDSRAAPAIESGDQIKSTLVETLRQLQNAATQARTKIDAFDVDHVTPEGASELRTQLTGLTSSVADSLAGLAPLLSENEQLRSALQNSATCKQTGSELFGSSS